MAQNHILLSSLQTGIGEMKKQEEELRIWEFLFLFFIVFVILMYFYWHGYLSEFIACKWSSPVTRKLYLTHTYYIHLYIQKNCI